MKPRKQTGVLFGPKEFDAAVERMDTKLLLDKQARQVKWLYNNSSKCTMVYDEKLVRLLVFKLEQKIRELEKESRADAIAFALMQNFSFPEHVLRDRYDAFLKTKKLNNES